MLWASQPKLVCNKFNTELKLRPGIDGLVWRYVHFPQMLPSAENTGIFNFLNYRGRVNLGDTFAVVALLATTLFVANNGFFEEISSSGRNLPEPKNVKAKGSKNSRKQRHQATKVPDVKRPSPLRWASFLTNSASPVISTGLTSCRNGTPKVVASVRTT